MDIFLLIKNTYFYTSYTLLYTKKLPLSSIFYKYFYRCWRIIMKLPVIPFIFDWNHTKNVKETYWEHFTWCMYSTMMFAIILPVGFIHGIFPFLLPEAPDALVVKWTRKFRERRQRTGQAGSRPE